MFQFSAFAFRLAEYLGLPHSEISGSMSVCNYPELIAAYHVLHRLQVPRHPPYTLPTFSLYLYSERPFFAQNVLLIFTPFD